MNFALSEDNLVLQQSARTFLEKEISLGRVLVPGATVADADYDRNWTKIVAMGWPGLIVDEAFGGLGLSCIDLAMILGEMGRTLAPSPFLGTLFGAWAIQKGGSQDQKERLLPPVASRTVKLALAVAESNGATDACAPGRPRMPRVPSACSKGPSISPRSVRPSAGRSAGTRRSSRRWPTCWVWPRAQPPPCSMPLGRYPRKTSALGWRRRWPR